MAHGSFSIGDVQRDALLVMQVFKAIKKCDISCPKRVILQANVWVAMFRA